MLAAQIEYEELDHGSDIEGRPHCGRPRHNLPLNVRRSICSLMKLQGVAPPLHHQLHLQHLQLAQLPQPLLRLALHPLWTSW